MARCSLAYSVSNKALTKSSFKEITKRLPDQSNVKPFNTKFEMLQSIWFLENITSEDTLLPPNLPLKSVLIL